MYTIATTFSLVLVLASSVTGKDVMLRGAKLNDLEVSSSIVAVVGAMHQEKMVTLRHLPTHVCSS
jgi:hypothetical protein